MAILKDLCVAVLATDGFEESELVDTCRALREAGAQVDIISPKIGEIQSFKHLDKSMSILVSRTLEEVKLDEYQSLLLPGGALNADALRADPEACALVKAMNDAGKPIAAICHAPWLLISAGLVKGRTLTSFPSIKDDLINAGANWVDREVCVDGNWVTSRKPDDIPAFNREMIKLFAQSLASSRSIAESA